MNEDSSVTRLLAESQTTNPGETFKLNDEDTGADETRISTPRDTLLIQTQEGEKEFDIQELNFTEQYQFRTMLGHGGQGEVWEAFHLKLNRDVAIKRAKNTNKNWNSFYKEAFTSAQLDHPNILPIYDIGSVDYDDTTVPALSMKRIIGKSWHSIIDDDFEKMDRTAFLFKHLPIFLDVLNAVDYAHSRGIIHRDLKPAQVMVGHFGEVYLLDWGLSIFLKDQDALQEAQKPIDSKYYFTLDTASNPAGSPAYMAPEQAMPGTAKLGFHTDMYLLGAILYELVMGHPPHKGHLAKEVIHKAAKNIYAELPDSISEELRTIINHCLKKNVQDRPENVTEIREAVERYLSGAGKVEKSKRITKEILAEDKVLFQTYEEVSEAMRKVGKAFHDWPENPEIDQARDSILEQYVNIALKENHFIIARLQADRIVFKKLREEMVQRVEEEREKASHELDMPMLINPKRIGIIGGMVLTIAAAFFMISQFAQKSILDEIKNQAEGIASVAAMEIRPEYLNAIQSEEDIFTGEFQRILNQLNVFRRTNSDIRFLHTWRPDANSSQNNWQVIVDSDPMDFDRNFNGTIEPSESGRKPLAELTDAPKMMDTSYIEQVPVSGIVKDSRGKFLRAFAPVIDLDESVPIALVGVDIEFSTIQNRFTRINMVLTIVAIVLIILFVSGLVLFFRSKQALMRSQLLEEKIQKQNLELCQQDLYLG